MTTLDEGTAEWAEDLRQIDITDPVLGGPGGPLNAQGIGLGRRSRWLKARLLGLEGGALSVVPSSGILLYSDGWEFQANSTELFVQTTVGTDTSCRILLPALPVGLTVSRIVVTLDGASGHTGLPSTMPHVELQRRYATQSPAGWSDLTGIAYYDSAADVAEYQAVHQLIVDEGLNGLFTPEVNRCYAVRLHGENGTYAGTGLACRGLLLELE